MVGRARVFLVFRASVIRRTGIVILLWTSIVRGARVVVAFGTSAIGRARVFLVLGTRTNRQAAPVVIVWVVVYLAIRRTITIFRAGVVGLPHTFHVPNAKYGGLTVLLEQVTYTHSRLERLDQLLHRRPARLGGLLFVAGLLQLGRHGVQFGKYPKA